MSSHWRDMRLRQAYPYWILGEVPAEDLPFIACNDLLAGTTDDEIVALAALSQTDTWKFDQVLARVFAHLRLPDMTRAEAAKVVAKDRIREVARRLVAREEDPLRGASLIYRYSAEPKWFDDDVDVDSQVARYGIEFLQLADALEARQDHSNEARQLQELIIEAAQSFLDGRPVPEWYVDTKSALHRGPHPHLP